MTIRRAESTDREALVNLGLSIQALHAENLPEIFVAPDRDALAEFFDGVLAGDSHVLVAEHGTTVLGYVFADLVARGATAFKHASTVLYIQHIAVSPAVQRQGVGARLMNAAASLGRELGASAVRLDSWSFNTDAHEFFAAHGYSPINIVFEHALDHRSQPEPIPSTAPGAVSG